MTYFASILKGSNFNMYCSVPLKNWDASCRKISMKTELFFTIYNFFEIHVILPHFYIHAPARLHPRDFQKILTTIFLKQLTTYILSKVGDTIQSAIVNQSHICGKGVGLDFSF